MIRLGVRVAKAGQLELVLNLLRLCLGVLLDLTLLRGDRGLRLVALGRDVQVGAGHHRDRRRDRAGCSSQQHGLTIGGAGGYAKHQAEDRDRAVLHPKHDRADRGHERLLDPLKDGL
jgi:hypothetical protein